MHPYKYLIIYLFVFFPVKVLASHLYLGLENYQGHPVLQHVAYDAVTGYSKGAWAVLDGAINHIAVDSRGGNDGGIFMAVQPEGACWLREYSFDRNDFVFQRQLWQDITDLAVAPGDKLYGFEKTNGYLMYYTPNGSSFGYPSYTSYGAGTEGLFVIGSDGWIILDTDGSPAGYNWLVEWSCDGVSFTHHNVNFQNYLPMAMAFSPSRHSVWMSWQVPSGEEYLSEFVYGSWPPTGTPRPYEIASTGDYNIRDLAVRADGVCMAVSIDYNGSPALLALVSQPVPAGDGSINIIATRVIPESILAIDPDGNTIHTIGADGYLRAWHLNPLTSLLVNIHLIDLSSPARSVAVSSTEPLPVEPPTDPWPWLAAEDLMPQGTYYEAIVPQTLDLAERAKISVRGLTRFLNPDDDYSQYLHMYYNTNPPYMTNYFSPGKNNWGKIVEATIMARSMCGSTENIDIELNTWKGMGRFVSLTNPIPTPMTCVMSALMSQYHLRPEPDLLTQIQAMAQAHIDLANVSGNTAYYWAEGPDLNDSMLGVIGYGWEAYIQGRAMRTMTEWYQHSGHAASLSLVSKLSNFMIDSKYWEPDDEGASFYASPKVVVSSEKGHFMGHHHSFSEMMLANLLYGNATKNVKLLEFARGTYEYLRTFGISRIGMFGEMCTTADMTLAAIYMSDFGLGDYWEDVDCYIRNHLTELQYIDPAKMTTVTQAMPALDPAQQEPRVDDFDDVLNRCVGVYLSDGSHPALIRDHTLLGVLCCTGNCTRALYHVWESIVRYKEGAAQINLLLNRASPWLDIDSYLPYEGKVVIRNKCAERISVRIPAWVNEGLVTCAVDGQPVSCSWLGRYVCLSSLEAGDVITILFPMVESTEAYTLLWKEDEFWKESTNPNSNWTPSLNPDVFTFQFRGNTLVDVSPRPQRIGYPLYERTYYCSGQAPEVSVVRYVASYQPQPGECYGRPKADVSGDCRVDIMDFMIMARQWLDAGIESLPY